MSPPVRQRRAARPKGLPKSQTSFAVFRVTPPPQPPTRNVKLPLRRVIQYDAKVRDAHTNRLDCKDLFSAAFNTSGFKSAFIHSVKVWTQPNQAGCNALTISPVSIGDRPNVGIDFADRSLDLNGRARVGFGLPRELGGPYKPAEVFCEIVPQNSTYVTVEVDVTFM